MEQKIREACMALANRFAFGFLVQQSGPTHLFVSLTCFVISSCSSLGNVAKVSYLVPIRNGMAVYDE